MSLTSPLKASSKPLHLYRRNAIWYFRWTFPSAVASLLNRRELKLGLKTPYLRLAAKRGTALAVRMVAFQARAEREQSMTPQVSTQQLETLLRAYVRDALDDFEHDLARRAVAVGNETPDPEIRAIDYIQQDATIRLRQRDTSAEASSALTLATAHGIPLSLDSAALAYLQRGILRADQCVSAVMIDRLRGIYRDDPFLSFPTQGTPVTTPLLVKRLSELARIVLILDVAKQGFDVGAPTYADKGVGTVPETWLPIKRCQVFGVLLAHVSGCHGLQILYQVRQFDRWIRLKQQVNVISLTAKFHQLTIPLRQQPTHQLFQTLKHVWGQALMAILH